ncbi:MAG: hypothetical protein ACM3YE_17245 [Bacteroidota bacterium]
MTALAEDRNTPRKDGDLLELPMSGTVAIFAGALTCVSTLGNAVPGRTDTDLKAAGRAEESVDNTTGDAGDKTVKIRRGVFKFENDETDPVTAANILSDCYVVDDQTVAATDGSSTRSKAGKVLGVEDDGVWVEIR